MFLFIFKEMGKIQTIRQWFNLPLALRTRWFLRPCFGYFQDVQGIMKQETYNYFRYQVSSTRGSLGDLEA